MNDNFQRRFFLHSDTYVDGELLLWLDATDINGDGNLSNEPFGGTVDQWRDKSGHSRHAGNGDGPSLLVNRWNSKNTLKFNGISNYLTVEDSSIFDIGEDGTIFIVSQGHDSLDWRPVLSKGGENQKGGNLGNQQRICQFHFKRHLDWDRAGELHLMDLHMFGP